MPDSAGKTTQPLNSPGRPLHIDAFLVNKMTDVDEAAIAREKTEVPSRYIQERVAAILVESAHG